MPRKARKPYEGILTVPSPKYDDKKSKFANALAWTESAILKLDALAIDRYSIERDNPNKWLLLALNLAAEYVPNFAPPPLKPPQGVRQDPFSGAADFILFSELAEAEIARKSVANAARHLVKKHPRYFKGKKPDALRKRYYLLKDVGSPQGQRLRNLVAHFGK
jgi:hypothetical protein